MFGRLLLQHRRAAGLSQSQLAQRSGLSARALRDLEHGRARAPQSRSTTLLTDALDLRQPDLEFFLDAARDGRRRRPTAGRAHFVRPVEPTLIGRDDELSRLLDRGAGGGVVTVIGPPGVGKSALALSAVPELARLFPDGTLLTDLRGTSLRPTGPSAALNKLLRAMAVPPQRTPSTFTEQSDLLRLLLEDRRMLLVFDNADDESQLRPLMAAGRGSLTLITSRTTLGGIASTHRLWLDPLDLEHTVSMLADIVGPDRVGAEPDAARELAEHCDGLPLASRIVGNRLSIRPGWRLADLAEQLRDERTRLDLMCAGDLRLRAAMDGSYRRLTALGRLAFRTIASVPGPEYTIDDVASVCSLPAREATLGLEELVDASLVSTAAPGRFRCSALIRLYAREQTPDALRHQQRGLTS